ncbi:SPP1 family predicted phage head-tail adaptor [Rhodoligotrophos appendicifer]|uniref:phage head closure protein n=1 Tax=Rhodoligotrophos appendicifer TaxID=987056 RepID=UPI0011851F10|nr:phage head closure protein [Rhodoligotrophos appendicifer]
MAFGSLLAAGELDRRITIQRSAPVSNRFNEKVDVWSDLATVWAKKEDLSDRERIAAQEVSAEAMARFRIRWSARVADVNAKDRIVYRGKVYGITAVKEIGRRVGLELSATAGAD